jgi:hypothetical protein
VLGGRLPLLSRGVCLEVLSLSILHIHVSSFLLLLLSEVAQI